MKRHGCARIFITDKLRSYGAAMKVIGNVDKQETGRWLNNRAEESGPCFDLGGCELYRNSSPSTPQFTTISMRSATFTVDQISS
jgi:transposase-like protein